ncbi:MAG TPA: hypothetical protein VHB27_08980 [Rhodopila sp.]|uniref:hypothetical protein n=1 Tax=Rhodopila sp. TaxID=2480087 RepID=UPI002C160239|nr:hypothetical protein [Rhodopila sp.]HVY15349.1 hypothetical protein [Rhodopila sp.]
MSKIVPTRFNPGAAWVLHIMRGPRRLRTRHGHGRRRRTGRTTRHLGLACAIALLALGGCTQAPVTEAGPPAQPPAAAISAQAAVAAEVARLQADLMREVPQAIPPDPVSDRVWIALAKQRLAASAVVIDQAQVIVVVDRNPRVQQLRIIAAQPADGPWSVIGGSKVSTGQAGRRGYFITPTGVFPHLTDILDYRALGTFNENHIRGLGRKGMRVWDFGWQTAEKGWQPDHETGEIRLLVHATDPDYLEQRLGHPASKGCIRVPASMNRFLDFHGILDADYERAAAQDARLAEILLPDRRPTELAGRLLVVVDSSPDSAEASVRLGGRTAGR